MIFTLLHVLRISCFSEKVNAMVRPDINVLLLIVICELMTTMAVPTDKSFRDKRLRERTNSRSKFARGAIGLLIFC